MKVETPVEEPPAEAVETKTAQEPVEEKVERPEDQKINDYDVTDPMHLMKIEFDSAQEDQYDITFFFTSASANQVKMLLSEVADAYEVNGKTIVLIPFLSHDEALEELSKEGIEYSEDIFVPAGEKADFDSLVGSRI